MIFDFLKNIFGSRNDRIIKKYYATVRAINALETQIASLDNDALRARTNEFRTRHSNGESLEQLLPEAFAVVREASKRVLHMRHFDVQLIGGMALHFGKIAEMRTGEGKTLAATLPSYLNALSERGVHIITVNDYLAKRDSEWMGKLYNFLGLEVGVITSQQSNEEKQVAYNADITYGTNNEFGFDYLRDNMEFTEGERRQRELNYAIVDEVDSILIDEARTPLIISGQAEGQSDLYVKLDVIAPLLTRCPEEKAPGDYWVDEKGHQVHLTESGHEHAELLLTEKGMLSSGSNLYESGNIALLHHLNAALRAHNLFLRDQHYVVQNDEVIIVDEFTGRLMAGRRWSDGLHQAVEAKEGVSIQSENQTLASITFQNYFRLYNKLAGMTGTADTEAFEFQSIYRLETVIIPTHRPMVRNDSNDLVFKTLDEKYQAILADIRRCHEQGQPVLVGTTSIENSELLSNLLDKEKLPHQVLNAKQHEREAEIIIDAGRPGFITIATNMAGRGTDIVLGGSIDRQLAQIEGNETLSDRQKEAKIIEVREEWQQRHNAVVSAGGLHIIGSERHESRRIDNQLRGRSGRQGDPGSSRFFLSLEDNLLRIFAGPRIKAIMERLSMPEGEAIEHPMVTRSLESAQRKVEAHNFDIRKQLLEYDDVANDQRKVIYSQRNELLQSEDISDTITAMREGVLQELFRESVPEDSIEEQWDLPHLENTLRDDYQVQAPVTEWLRTEPELPEDEIFARIQSSVSQVYQQKEDMVGPEGFRQFERNIMLYSIDNHWREHLAALDYLRQGIHLRGYAQKNPKQEYKREAFELFQSLLDTVRREVTKIILTVQLRPEDAVESVPRQAVNNLEFHHDELTGAVAEDDDFDTVVASAATKARQIPASAGPKIGRNEPCPCGSGKKYKRCHGALR